VEAFDLKELNASNPAFDVNKLNHFNAHYIMQLSDEELALKLKSFAPENADLDKLKRLAPLVKERMKVLSDFKELTRFIFEDVETPKTGWKEEAKQQLLASKEVIEESEWDTEELNKKFLEKVKENSWKTGQFFMNLRLAIAGQEISPPITESIIILGKDKTLSRINQALASI